MWPTLMLVAGLLALVLLLVLYWRTAQQIALLKAEAERLRVVQRDMSTDVRARLDEGARTWESVEHEMRPRLDQLEPSVADLSATLEEHLPGVGEARQRLAGLEERVMEAEAELRETMGTRTAEMDARFGHIEDAVRTLRDAADERLGTLSARITALEEAPPPVLEPPPPEDEIEEASEEETEETIDEPAEDEGALAAVEAAIDAPATFGSPPDEDRDDRHGKEGARDQSGTRWLLLVLALALGLAAVITTLA